MFQILGLMVVRKMLDMVFSQHDLAWLDDLLPEKEKKKKDDDKKKGKQKEKEKRRTKGDDREEEVRDSSCRCPLLEGRVVNRLLIGRVFVRRTKSTSTPTTRPAQSPTWTAGTVSSDFTSPIKTWSILTRFSLSGGPTARPPPHAAFFNTAPSMNYFTHLLPTPPHHT